MNVDAWRAMACGLLIIMTLPLAAEQILEIPIPDLAGVEQVVVDQLHAGHARVAATLSDRTSTPIDKAAAIGGLGHLYHTYGYLDAAAAAYRIASMLDRDAFQWAYSAGVVAQKQHRFPAAVDFFQRANATTETASLNYLTHIRMGESYEGLNDLPAARAAYERALLLEPDGVPVLARLGKVLLQQRSYAAAVESLNRALALNPQISDLHYPLAMAYRGLGNADLAMQHLALRGTVGIQPADPLQEILDALLRGARAYVAIGRSALAAHRYQDAVDAFQRAVREDPLNVDAWTILADTHLELGQSADALASFEQALHLQPDNLRLHYAVGTLLINLGESRRAIAHVRQFVDANPEYLAATAALALAYAEADQCTEAIRWIDRAMALAGDTGQDPRIDDLRHRRERCAVP